MIGISTKTIYAVAAIYQLSEIEKDKVLKIKEIAAKASVPQNFLEQILLELRKVGILESVKGAYGGYKLAKDLNRVTLRDIVETLETDAFNSSCKTENMALKLFWEDVSSEITSVFDRPLSQLIDYRLKASQALDFSI
ncbi:MAG TPA: Rrf2 family transcriptional regulator [Epsilonproteobacteria bacterium]|nr:Rrf2 family transcriptional regulator [Campylobacterota bacterium]